MKNTRWLNKRRGSGDESVQLTSYIGWDWSTFDDGCTLKLEYSGSDLLFPSDPFTDRYSLVDSTNIGLLGDTFGPAFNDKEGAFDNRYVIYAVIDLMALEFHKQNPGVNVGLSRYTSFVVAVCNGTGATRFERRRRGQRECSAYLSLR